MKKVVFIIIVSLLSQVVFCQNAISTNQKIAQTTKVWGFLKYYHPQVAKGKFD